MTSSDAVTTGGIAVGLGAMQFGDEAVNGAVVSDPDDALLDLATTAVRSPCRHAGGHDCTLDTPLNKSTDHEKAPPMREIGVVLDAR